MEAGSRDKDLSHNFWIKLHRHAHGSQHFIKKHKTISLMGFIVLLLIVFMLINTNMKPAKHASKNQQPTVVLAKSETNDVPVFLNALGAVTPTESITVKTQINGQLLKVLFKEGQMVKTGELLAQIDARPYQALLTQYQGQLSRDQALLANAQLDLARYELLWKQDSISKQILDTQKWLVKQYEGTVKTDEGLVQTATLDLMYCNITSPISGRVGLRLVDPGNFVQTSDTTGLFVLNKVRPITVIFSLPEDNIPQVLKQINNNKSLLVEAYNRTQNSLLESGSLLTIDNQIDPSTGTVKLKGVFKNATDALFPNQFVNIRLKIDTLMDAITIPTSAVQYGVKNYVYVYDPQKHNVHFTPIEVGVTWGDKTVISSGLKKGQWVVIEGTDKLTDLATVKVFDAHQIDKAPLPHKAQDRGAI